MATDHDMAPAHLTRTRTLTPLFLLAGAVAALLSAVSTTRALALLGLPDPGPVTTYGIPALTALGEVSGVFAVGSLLLAAFLVPPQRSGVLDVDGYAAVRNASTALLVWAVSATLLVPLTLSDSSGRPVGAVLREPVLFVRAIGDVDTAVAWAVTALLAAAAAAGCRLVLQHRWTPALFGFAVLTLMPRAVSGHASSGGDHDIATDSLILHIGAVSVWMGGLLALLVHARRGGGHLPAATRRYSRVALAMFCVVAASGVMNALVRVPLVSVWGSTYGSLVLAKVAAVLALGYIGWRQRRHIVRGLNTAVSPAAARRRQFVRLSAVEALILVSTVGLGVALGRTPPPAPAEQAQAQAHEEALGFVLDGPPTIVRLLFSWRVDVLFVSLAVVLAAAYLVNVHRRRAAGLIWRRRWTVSFVAGTAVLVISTSSGVGLYGPAIFSAHLAGAMACAVLVPMLLVLGRPLTLLAPSLTEDPNSVDSGGWGLLRRAFESRVCAVAATPWVSAAVFLLGLYAVYPGGMFDQIAGSHVAGIVLRLWLLGSGFAFFWSTISLDPVPVPSVGPSRLLASIAVLGGFAFFLVTLIDTDPAIGADFYNSLRLDWNQDLLADQRRAGNLAWAIGELPLLLAAVLAATRWSSADTRLARLRDEESGEDDRTAYNAMLDRLAGPQSDRRERS